MSRRYTKGGIPGTGILGAGIPQREGYTRQRVGIPGVDIPESRVGIPEKKGACIPERGVCPGGGYVQRREGETQGSHHQKSKTTGYQWPHKRTDVLQNCFYKLIIL